jgi:hypothetical protein
MRRWMMNRCRIRKLEGEEGAKEEKKWNSEEHE